MGLLFGQKYLDIATVSYAEYSEGIAAVVDFRPAIPSKLSVILVGGATILLRGDDADTIWAILKNSNREVVLKQGRG